MASLLIAPPLFAGPFDQHGPFDASRSRHSDLDSTTTEKLDWLDKWGTPIRFGPGSHRRTKKACRKGNHAMIRRSWGVQMEIWHGELVRCPGFF